MGPSTKPLIDVDDAAAPSSPPLLGAAPLLALVEVVDRDGQPRQSFPVHAWPLRIGRALDNDIVLSDPHLAAHHLVIAPGENGLLALQVAESRNGALLGRKRLRGGDSIALAADGEPIDLDAGRTHLRLRLPGHALAPELALAPTHSLGRRVLPLLLAALLLIAGTLFNTYLDTDADSFGRAAGNALLTGLIAAAVWCTAWALMSKTFTRQAHFGWHLRVFLFASFALLVVAALPALLAFMFSWPWLTDFDFIGTILVIATALYFHLLAVEPARHRQLKFAAVTCAVVAVGLSMWFNWQRRDQLGDELYMSHLFPPALRIAKPVSTDAFIDGLGPLKATLDKKAKQAGGSDSGGPTEDE